MIFERPLPGGVYLANDGRRPAPAPVAKALTRVVLYYALLFTAGALIQRALPSGGLFAKTIDLLGGDGVPLHTAQGAIPGELAACAPRLSQGGAGLSPTVVLR